MIITFLGHSSLYNTNGLFEKIEATITQKISPFEKTLFYCGGYGDFDELCAKVCRSIKEKNENCEIVFITPYLTAPQQEKMNELKNSGLYDSFIYPPLEKIPHKLAIIKRNEWMICESDLIIAYVKNSFGGAYRALEYSRKKNKEIINLAQ